MRVGRPKNILPITEADRATAEERKACADVVRDWADKVEQQKSVVGPEQLRLLAKSIQQRGNK